MTFVVVLLYRSTNTYFGIIFSSHGTQNAKAGKSNIRKSPICRKARGKPNIQDTVIMPHRTDVLNRIFKRIIGDETATQYYLRHTFATKCQEYVRPDIVDIWMDIAPEGLSDGFIRTFPTSLCKSKWTRLFSIFKRYLFPKTFPKRACVLSDFMKLVVRL